MSIFCKVEVLCVSTYLLTTVTGSGDILILVDIKSTSLHKTLGSGMFSHTVWYIAIAFGLSKKYFSKCQMIKFESCLLIPLQLVYFLMISPLQHKYDYPPVN